jgi:hypothetical protein
MEFINDYTKEVIMMEEDPNDKLSVAAIFQQEEIKIEVDSYDQPAPSACVLQEEIGIGLTCF